MNEKFDKFTERARKVLILAQEEAQRFNHNYIGAEHLLLGLIREEESMGAKALTNLGVKLNIVRSAMEFLMGHGDRIVTGDIGLTPRAKKVVELAVDEARRLGHHYIGTEHLLLGLIREGEGIPAGVLESLGVTLERGRASVREILNMPGPAPFSGRAATGELDKRTSSLLTLVCRDVAATSAFYVDYLGAATLPSPSDDMQELTGAEGLLQMPFGEPLLALRTASPDEATAPTTDGAGAVELNFFTRDGSAIWSALQKRGAPNLSEINPVPGAPNARMFTLTDPDGRTLRFYGKFNS